MKCFHLKHRVQEATLLAGFLFGSITTMAQSGIDSLDNGGSLGGDPEAVGTGVEHISVKSPATDHAPEYYTLSGQRVQMPRRGEVYIIKWREQGRWRARKVVSIR